MTINQQSAGVRVIETDVTSVVPVNSPTSAGTVGEFNWGPVGSIVSIDYETTLVNRMGRPTLAYGAAFSSCLNYLKYSNDLKVIRVCGAAAVNAADDSVDTNTGIFNEDRYDIDSASLTGKFYARYPGTLGNSIVVHYCNATGYANWVYKNEFQFVPDTAGNGEYHIVITLGGSIVERMTISVTETATNFQNQNIYGPTYIRNNSQYIYAGSDFDDIETAGTGSYALEGGTDVKATLGDYQAGWTILDNPLDTEVSIFFAGGGSDDVESDMSQTEVTTLARTIVETAATRKDCFAFISPPRSLVVTTQTSLVKAQAIVDWRGANLNLNNSYGALDGNYKLQYNNYTNSPQWVGFSADAAGCAARVDRTADTWTPPMGVTHGQILGVDKLAIESKISVSDILYPAGINPVQSIVNEGVMFMGDKTLLNEQSSFNRIGVRRLFITVEKNIARFARPFIGQFNDEFTRSRFVTSVNEYLRLVQNRRGILRFRVKCDIVNNPDSITKNNGLVGDIWIEPNTSINFIQINFNATDNDVDFSETEGAA